MLLSYQLLVLLGLILANSCAQQIQLYTADALPDLSPECVSALTANLSCEFLEVGNSMYQLTANISSEILQSMCTDECKSSIVSYRQAVESACANDEYDDSGNSTSIIGDSGIYRPIVLPDYYFTNYNQRCLKDLDGNYCLFHLQTTDSQDECDVCGLQMFQAELSNGYFYNDDLAEQYSSLISSCGVTTLKIEQPTAVVVESFSISQPTPTTCGDRSAIIKPGDTCDTFAAANNVSTWRMLIENGLQGGCTDFPTNGTLCVTGHCQTHLTTAEDTCMSLASQYEITITQLITWNSVLNSLCSNFNILVGHQICVSYPGNATSQVNTYASGKAGAVPTVAAPIPTNIVAGTNVNCGKYYQTKDYDYCQAIAMAQGISLNDFLFLNPELDSNCTNLYLNYSYCVQPVGNIETYPGYASTTGSGTVATSTSLVTQFIGNRVSWGDLPKATNLTSWTPIATPSTAPLANKTRLDCEEYTDNTYGAVPCSWLALGVTLPDFAIWNPSVDVYDCNLANNTRYCTLLGSGYDTSNLNITISYYADVPSDAATNSTENCYTWYRTTEAISCEGILSNANISLSAFYAWNPSVNSDCSNVWLNVSYCILGDGYDDTYYATSTYHTSTVPTTTSSCGAATITAPGPTQTGIACDCNKFALQEDDTYCQGMADDHGITIDEFYKLNPALGGDCSGLWSGYAYCVGVPGLSTSTSATPTLAPITTSSASCATATPPGPTQSGIPCTCTKFLMQADGVYCYDMAQESGITLGDLYVWNPALGGVCSGLWTGYAYCVGVL